jgi:hypothetical protein
MSGLRSPEIPHRAMCARSRDTMSWIKMQATLRYHAVDAHDGWDADEAISRPNKRAPTRRYLKSLSSVSDVAGHAFELRRGRVILSGVHDASEAVPAT